MNFNLFKYSFKGNSSSRAVLAMFPVTPKPKSPSTKRVHWLTVHRGERLTIAYLRDNDVFADGCHSTLGDDGNVITYIHLPKKCRQNAIDKCLPTHESARIVDAATEKAIQASGEFQTLVQHLDGQNMHVVSDGVEFALLSKRLPSATMPPSQLEDENKKLRHEAMELRDALFIANSDLEEQESELKRLRVENTEFRRPGAEEQESELKRLRIENIEFKRLGAETKEVRRLNRELMTLKDRLEEKVLDCKAFEMTLKMAREDNEKLEKEVNSSKWRNFKK